MKTLDELDALYERATKGPWHAMPKPTPSHSDHGYRTIATLPEARGREPLHVYAEAASMRSEPFAGYRWGPGDAEWIAAMHSAWPEVRERLRRAEVVETAAQAVFAVQGPPYDIDDYTQRMHALRAALTEEPPHDDVNCASCAKVRATLTTEEPRQ